MINDKVTLGKLMLDDNMPSQERVSNDEPCNLLYWLEIPETQNVLGLGWEPHTDMLRITTREKITNIASCKLTKRKVLSLISSVFDPLGLLSPLGIKEKIFIQTLSKDKMSWDQPLSQEQVKIVEEILNKLQGVGEFSFPRLVVFTSVELHSLVDALSKAYGAAVYVVDRNSECCNLLVRKSQSSPIPRGKINNSNVRISSIISRLSSIESS